MDAQTHYAQISLLLNAHRFEDAETRLREHLAQHPNEAQAHALLAYVLSRQKHNAEALQEANRAVHLDPTYAHAHFYRAYILLKLKRKRKALEAIQEALRLRPTYASYYALLSSIHLSRKRWQAALKAAEEGLRHDPENARCLNSRGIALNQMGERAEATESVESALARDPESAVAHATLGWVQLNQGKPESALAYFREALRLNPLSTYAREGIVEALKARNPIYRVLLRYFLWMSTLTTGEQWGFLALTSGERSGLRAVARAFPPLYIIVLPLQLLYFTFAVLTWVARPLFALIVRLDPLGRLSLPREEIVASNWVGACLILALLGTLAGGVTGIAWQNLSPWVSIPFALMMILPLAGVFRTPRGWGRIVLALYTGVLACIALGASVIALFGIWSLVVVLALVFLVGWFLYTWAANIVLLIQKIAQNA
jgi:tetratricopeptide (TPR) repeat protein